MQMALTCASINSLFISSPQPESFLLAHASPYAMHLAGSQRESKAFGLDRTPGADLFGLRYLLHGLFGRRDGKEQVRIAGSAGGSGPPVHCRSQHAFLLSAMSLARHEVMVVVRPATSIVSADDFSRPGVPEQPFDTRQFKYATGAAFPLLAHRAAREPALVGPHGADERRSWS